MKLTLALLACFAVGYLTGAAEPSSQAQQGTVFGDPNGLQYYWDSTGRSGTIMNNGRMQSFSFTPPLTQQRQPYRYRPYLSPC